MCGKHRIKTVVPVLGFLIMTACASSPEPAPGIVAEGQLRDSELDVVFATEFPVAGKAEALSRADAAKKSGDLDRALFFYVKALRFEPDDEQLLTLIGGIHQFRDNPVMAVRAYTLALRANPDYADALVNRGLILLAHEEDDRARADLAHAAALEPAAWRAHNGLGLLADRRGAHEDAIAHYDLAIESHPDSGMLYNNRGYSSLLAGRYTAAEADLVKAARQLGYPRAWINLGVLLAKQGRYDEAVEAFNEVIEAPDALNKAAESAMANNDDAVAERLLEEAIHTSPRYFPAAEENLAELRLRAGGG